MLLRKWQTVLLTALTTRGNTVTGNKAHVEFKGRGGNDQDAEEKDVVTENVFETKAERDIPTHRS